MGVYSFTRGHVIRVFIREDLFGRTLRELNTIKCVANPKLPTNVLLGVNVRRNIFTWPSIAFNVHAYTFYTVQ